MGSLSVAREERGEWGAVRSQVPQGAKVGSLASVHHLLSAGALFFLDMRVGACCRCAYFFDEKSSWAGGPKHVLTFARALRQAGWVTSVYLCLFFRETA